LLLAFSLPRGTPMIDYKATPQFTKSIKVARSQASSLSMATWTKAAIARWPGSFSNITTTDATVHTLPLAAQRAWSRRSPPSRVSVRLAASRATGVRPGLCHRMRRAAWRSPRVSRYAARQRSPRGHQGRGHRRDVLCLRCHEALRFEDLMASRSAISAKSRFTILAT
jgi:hypothetical protein